MGRAGLGDFRKLNQIHSARRSCGRGAPGKRLGCWGPGGEWVNPGCWGIRARKLLQGAGVPLPQEALASARYHPPILGLQESLTPSRGSVTSFPKPPAKVWGQHVHSRAHVCVSACECV